MVKLRLISELSGHEDRVWQASWDCTGNRLATCSGDKSARIWAPIASERFFKAQQHSKENISDGSSNESMDVDQTSASTWQCLDIIDNAHKRTVRSIAFEPTSSKAVATASFDGTTAIWEKEDDAYECVATLEGHENEAKCVAWSPSGQLLATCGRDKSVWIWESNGEGDFDCISVLMEHTQDVKMVLWHPINDMLVSFSYDDTMRVWKEDDDDWYSAATLTGHKSTVWGGAFSPDGKYLASVSDDRTIRVWTQSNDDGSRASGADKGFYYKPDANFKCIAVVPDTVHSRAIYSVSWAGAPAGAPATDLGYLATGCGDNSLRVLKVTAAAGEDTGVTVELVCEHKDAHGLSDINCVRWNPVHFGWLATCGDDSTVRIWNLDLSQD
ncbi:Cytosolic iron-sulfur protein assembly protein [Coemansia asiatica]|uniref:Probable cytosolic iron-sulfur protein assembly protein 1 n=1 Tax=Coemansia asiatica TaxID=1052880 RepID=A0A9W8CKI6_9FUNG|nr:Cytosolic iron-sulfur protein assembly protein [Coemansia asiatica]